MSKTILMVHGRDFKPPKRDLQKLWFEALRWGIERDHPEKLAALNDAKLELAYYGDISNHFLHGATGEPKPRDVEDRRQTLERLKQYKSFQFNKTTYKKLPGYNPWMEAVADVISGPLNFFGLSEPLIERVAPDMRRYWGVSQFGSDIRAVLTAALIRAMKREGDICLIGHSLGSMICYDVLWKLSHYSEYRRQPWNRDVSLWITLGSPLSDVTVQDNLKGAGKAEIDRYPKNVVNWLNVAAEDDYISHDQRLTNDFRPMLQLGYVDSIRDKGIYNLAVRHGESNPHHGTGYLLHPTVANAVADWL